MKTRTKILLGVAGFYLLSLVLIVVIFGFTRRDNTEFQPQNEFKLDTWVSLPGRSTSTRRCCTWSSRRSSTCVTMVYIAKRMQARPNRVQTAVEVALRTDARQHHAREMDDRMAAKWFPFIGALFLFIWFSNLIGYIPLPTNTEHKFDVSACRSRRSRSTRRPRTSRSRSCSRSSSSSPTTSRAFAPRARRLPQEPVPAGVDGRHGRPHLRPGVPLELHAPALALRTTLRQHPRRPPDHPVHVRRAGRAARASRRWAGSRSRSASSCSSSRSAWWRRCRRSSSPP